MNIYIQHKNFRELAILLIFFFLFGPGCVEPYEPKIDKYESLLIIEGKLSTQEGSAKVFLTRSYPYNEKYDMTYVSGATVIIKDSEGNSWDFYESEADGCYYPIDETFQGETGISYMLYVRTSEGVEYESDFEEILTAVPINDLWFDFLTNDKGEKTGVTIKLDIENKADKETNFLWDFEETWEFEVPYDKKYEPGGSVIMLKKSTSPSLFDLPNSRTCYSKVLPALFLIETTTNSSSNSLMGFSLYNVDNSTNRLHIKYSSLIIQHVISDKTYSFYKQLKEINEDQGSLYDKIPSTLTGNIKCITDPLQPVLGYFLTSGSVTKRIFINRDDLPKDMNIPTGFEDCKMEILGMYTQGARLDSLLKAGWVKMDSTVNEIRQEPVLTITNKGICCDCQLQGTLIKPDFWDDF